MIKIDKSKIDFSNAYHEWHDKWPYWSDLYEAERFIVRFVRRYSRCTLVTKEKYGTIRYSYLFPTSKLFPDMQRKFGRKVLKLAIMKACKKWPHIIPEILDDYDESCI